MKKNKEKIKQLLLLIGKSKWLYLGSLTAIGGEIAAESAGNLVIRHIIDKIILEDRGMKLIILFTIIFVAISASRALFSFLEGKEKAKVSETVARDIRNRMYDHIQHLSFKYHDTAQTGELVQRSTSDVEAATEKKIRDALSKLMEGRTNFIIAHRIQTLKMADRILVMKDGEIVQEGTHNELVKIDGFYKQVCTLQTEIETELQHELASAGLQEEHHE
ncbi:MAG: ABC transporter transmembrane domain-containing protein [Spirochaetia bacterium]|nr:ABC transporter transmembrane domain-containing protein [Spirochaetia bacterium]